MNIALQRSEDTADDVAVSAMMQCDARHRGRVDEETAADAAMTYRSASVGA